MDVHKKAARRAVNTGKKFVAVSGDVVVGTGDTLTDILLIQALSDIDYGQVLEVAGSAVSVVGDIAGGVVEIAESLGDL
jgi:hypothetical protein